MTEALTIERIVEIAQQLGAIVEPPPRVRMTLETMHDVTRYVGSSINGAQCSKLIRRIGAIREGEHIVLTREQLQRFIQAIL